MTVSQEENCRKKMKLSTLAHLTTELGNVSRISRLSQMDLMATPEEHRKTAIICTIGPKTKSVESLTSLRKAGMNVVRMNFSHGSHEYHGSVIDNTRESVREYPGRPVAIALDTRGPEIRTGLLTNPDGIVIEKGHEFILTTDESRKENGDKDCVYVDYKNLPRVVTAPSGIIYVDDGILALSVVECFDDKVKVRANNTHLLKNRKGVNLPNTIVDLPALSEKDKSDLKFGVEKKVDMVFASFIRKPQDVKDIREWMGPEGKDIMIISKIENQEGVQNFDKILEVSDGIMVARGDLGIEIPAEKVFVSQKSMIARCNIVGKPVICATQMLDSMTNNPRPTRAEVSDVANAVLDGADCVMLSGETASGDYPIESVMMMNRICLEAEAAIPYRSLFEEMRTLSPNMGVADTIASSAANASLEKYVACIICLTTSGKTAHLVAKYRPRVPVIAVTRLESTARKIHLWRGCFPLYFPEQAPNRYNSPIEWQKNVDERVAWSLAQVKANGFASPGQTIVVIQGYGPGPGLSNMMQLMPCP